METQTVDQTQQNEAVVTVNEKQYAMLIHLLQIVGILIPLILWLIKKDSSKFIDDNGKIVINWFLSCLIYGIAGAILSLVFIGTFILMALGICHLIFLILGSIKANNGELWPYPLSIKFLK